ncbi:AraC family transcriptional regulator [Acidovorax sp. LjRoot66]|uniref:AraC family transcriptional regulator n=1 Tax=Acidovorax sp. LjRoot66 TaxID=3342334 RepID=UPI003ECF581D
MDPLSQVFSLLRVQSLPSARIEVRGPWAMRFDGRPHAKFGAVLQGAFWLWTEDGTPPLHLKAGDFYLLTRGQSYCTGSDPSLEAIDGRDALARLVGRDGVVRFGEAGDKVSAAGGRFVFDGGAKALLLDWLPPIIHVPARSQGAAALQALLELLRLETQAVRPGAAVIATNLATMVLMQCLRVHLASGVHTPGWLGALHDPKIGPALGLLHSDHTRAWTLVELGSHVAMSRTAFTERFKALVGVPPLRYLHAWRMAVAAAALKAGDLAIAQVAESVGYGSPAAFSSAFLRATGMRPGQYRSSRAASWPGPVQTQA